MHCTRPVGVAGSRHLQGEKLGPQELGSQSHCYLLRHLCHRQSGAWETCLQKGLKCLLATPQWTGTTLWGLTARTTLRRGAGPGLCRRTRQDSSQCPHLHEWSHSSCHRRHFRGGQRELNSCCKHARAPALCSTLHLVLRANAGDHSVCMTTCSLDPTLCLAQIKDSINALSVGQLRDDP